VAPLFSKNRYDRVVIDSILEGHIGAAHADSEVQPSVARLDSGAFTVLGGDPHAPAAIPLVRHSPVYYVTPENDAWRRLLRVEFGSRISLLTFTVCSPRSLDGDHLAELAQQIPAGFDLRRIDDSLAHRLPSDMANPYFLESFHSVEDFLQRGIGFCILHQGRIVSAATSTAASNAAIEIEIETSTGFRNRGLGTVVGARLALYCVENGLEPQWMAENRLSEQLARKLGYTPGVSYETFQIDSEP
jgi:hypothetical protein